MCSQVCMKVCVYTYTHIYVCRKICIYLCTSIHACMHVYDVQLFKHMVTEQSPDLSCQ